MKHQPIRIDASADSRVARRAALRSAEQFQRETPGAYMRKCRKRADLTRTQVAEKICGHFGAQAFAESSLRDLELDQPGDYARLIRSLHAHDVFAFSPAVFYQLAAATCDPGFDECHAA